MSSTQLPLASQQTFSSSNFEEVEAIYAGYCFPVHFERTHRSLAFNWQANYATLGDVTLSAHDVGGGVRCSSDNGEDVVLLSIPIGKGAGEHWSGRDHVELVPGRRGTFVAPGVPGRVALEPEYRCFNVSFNRNALSRAFATLTGRTPRTPLRFPTAFDMTTPGASAFLRLLRLVATELDEVELSPMARDRMGEAVLFQLLHSQPNDHTLHLATSPEPAEPAQVRRVAEYLESRFSEPLCIGDLTRLTGTSARSIQAGFRKHRGCSPMEFLRAVRLDRARTALRATGGRHVKDIARACGFEHMGRFSAYYRARFGETPLQTLARRQR